MSHQWVDALNKVIGKRINGIVFAESLGPPRHQLFLIFDDGTHYELYGDDISGCKDIDRGGMDWVRSYVSRVNNPRLTVEIPAHEESEDSKESKAIL